MKNQRKPQINVELKQELIAELKNTSTVIEVPYAQIVREAIREKISDIKRNDARFIADLEPCGAKR